MANLTNAADGVLKLRKSLQGVFDLADAVKELGSIEDATKERQALLADVSAKHDAAKEALAATERSIKLVLAQQATDTDELQRVNAEAIDAARTTAEALVKKAKEDAAALVERAQTDATRIRTAQDEQSRKAQEDLVKVQGDIHAASKALEAVKAEEAKLAAKVEALKQTAQKILA